MLPHDPIARVRMRLWIKQVDDSILIAVGILSTCIAFRYQHFAREPQELKACLENMVDRAKRLRTRLAIEQGMDSPDFAPAVLRFERLLNEMEQTLAERLFNRPAYEEGIRRWFNPKYLELFDTHRDAARQRINEIAGA